MEVEEHAKPIFRALLLPCIILNANWRTKKREAWKWGCWLTVVVFFFFFFIGGHHWLSHSPWNQCVLEIGQNLSIWVPPAGSHLQSQAVCHCQVEYRRPCSGERLQDCRTSAHHGQGGLSIYLVSEYVSMWVWGLTCKIVKISASRKILTIRYEN